VGTISRIRGISVRSVNIRSVLRHPDLSANAHDDGDLTIVDLPA